MSDELERKRQEKIANFKINFNDSEAVDKTPEGNERQAAAAVAERRVPVNTSAPSRTPVSQPEGGGADLNSYSSAPAPESSSIDKATLRKAKKIDRRRRRWKAKKNRIIFRAVWIVMLVLVSFLLGRFLMVGVNDILAVGREEEHIVSITIPEDATLDQITDILYDNQVINSKPFFKLFATMTKATSGFTKGTFDIATNKDYQAIINYMQSDMNRTDVVTLRFTEGMSLRQYAKILESGGVCSAAAFLEKCNSDEFDENYEFIADIKNDSKRQYKLEGYLFPDTYDFYVGEKPDVVIMKFLANYRKKMYNTKTRADGFEKRATIEQRAKQAGMSMEELITLASLIQAEAADKEDMYYVSSVIHNRLATMNNGGMNANGEGGFDYLQLDSTVYYPYLSESDVPAGMINGFEGTYDTYKLRGLPPGPICNPGMDAVEAALNPYDTNYYYFCHKPAVEDQPAESYYAETMDVHVQNLEKAGLTPRTNTEPSEPEESGE